MAQLSGIERSHYVKNTFKAISGKYDLMNRLMTAGMDRFWRKEVLRKADLKPTDRILDLGTGTGDLARGALKIDPSLNITAADFTLEMMLNGKDWGIAKRCNADALQLPFPDACFDKVISGFLMRNVSDLRTAISEQFRVLKPGGRVVILDTTRPRKHWLSPFVRIYLRRIIPFLGKMITGNKAAYTYLPSSTENFVSAEELAHLLTEAGFQSTNFHIRMFGTIAIHAGSK